MNRAIPQKIPVACAQNHQNRCKMRFFLGERSLVESVRTHFKINASFLILDTVPMQKQSPCTVTAFDPVQFQILRLLRGFCPEIDLVCTRDALHRTTTVLFRSSCNRPPKRMSALLSRWDGCWRQSVKQPARWRHLSLKFVFEKFLGNLSERLDVVFVVV